MIISSLPECQGYIIAKIFPFQALKLLHNSTEFLPYVIYLAPPPPEEYKVSLNGSRGSQNIELAVSKG